MTTLTATLHTTSADIPVTILSQQFDPLANKTWLLLKSEQPIPHPHYGTTRQGWFDSNRVTVPDADEVAALDNAKASLNAARLDRIEQSNFSIAWFLDSDNLVDLELAKAHLPR